jgi:hypothetical protein
MGWATFWVILGGRCSIFYRNIRSPWSRLMRCVLPTYTDTKPKIKKDAKLQRGNKKTRRVVILFCPRPEKRLEMKINPERGQVPTVVATTNLAGPASS